MANFLEDGVAKMMGTLLASAGASCVYRRNGVNSPNPVVMRKSRQHPMQIDNGNGSFIEVMVTDFITDPATLPYPEPIRGDELDINGETYSVQSLTNGKVYFQAADSMIRIHTTRKA